MKKMLRKAIIGLSLLAIILVNCSGPSQITTGSDQRYQGDSQDRPWSFGLIADTQWDVNDDGYNPNTVAANIIRQIDQKFISAGVKIVVAIGDTVNTPSKVSIGTRALYSQDLYNAGIGFYPLRGNHEASGNSAYLKSGPELRYAFPQIGTGINNRTPVDVTNAVIPAADLANNPPATKTGQPFIVGASFSEPTAVNAANNSVSYSFRFRNATFVLLDQFDVSGNYYDSTLSQQQQWMDDTLFGRPTNTHAFVFVHKNILGGHHKDNMFGGNIVPTDPAAGKDPGDGNGMDISKLTTAELAALTAKQTAENRFIASMQDSKTPLVISGHDHSHYFSLVTSPDGKSQVHQLIAQSASSKFYIPVLPVSANDVPIQQDLGRIGYYIFTVDGPRVTIDYYGDSTEGLDHGLKGREFNFVRMSTINYGLNGKENIVGERKSYTMSDNTTLAAAMEKGFKGTAMSILGGNNGGHVTTNYGKKVSTNVTTAWAPASGNLASDILRLSGMSKTLGRDKTDEYILAMSYIPGSSTDKLVLKGNFGLLTKDTDGSWVSAVTKNLGITQRFILGAWHPNYTLGTCGVDTATHTAWAVLNHDGDFAVGQGALSK